MKNVLLKSGLFLIALVLVCMGYAQTDTLLHDSAGIVIDTIVDPAPGGTGITLPILEEWFAKGMGPLMSALILIFGYLGKWVPGFNKIDDATYRVLAFAVLLGAGFVYLGNDVWQVAVSYFGATSMYEVILKKLFGGSPRTDDLPREKSVLAPKE